jgi:hypothetical protein
MNSIAQTSPRDSEIIKETALMGDSLIRQRKQPQGAQNSSTK